MMKRLASLLSLLACIPASAQENNFQPFAAHTRRVLEALEQVGEPLSSEDQQGFQAALADEQQPQRATEKIESILDKRALFVVEINPEMRVKVARGPSKAELVEGGWRVFLVKIQNASGTTAKLRAHSPQGEKVFSQGNQRGRANAGAADAVPIQERWLDMQVVERQPLGAALSGMPLEYRMVQFYSRDAGQRSAAVGFDVGQGTQDLGFRNEVDVLFSCVPARKITLRVRDERGEPTTASFLFRDRHGRVTPSQAKRLAPEFGFHPQI